MPTVKMSQKRRLEDKDKITLNEYEQPNFLLPFEDNAGNDSTDEELPDSDFHDDVEDEFEGLNLSSDDDDDDTGAATENNRAKNNVGILFNSVKGDKDSKDKDSSDDSEWEDIDSDDEACEGDQVEGKKEETDSAYIESPVDEPEDNSENVETHKKRLAIAKSKHVQFRLDEKKNIRKQRAKLLKESATVSTETIQKVPIMEGNKTSGENVSQTKIEDKAGRAAKAERKKRHRKKKQDGDKDIKVPVSAENQKSDTDRPEEYDEYEEDSSDEEDLRNTIGNIPINWYDEYPHLGYGLDGLPVMKPAQGDMLDKFLDRLENPDYYRTVFDKQTGQQVRLSDEHLDFINRVMHHTVPDASFNLYEPFPDLYSHEVMEMPLSGRPEHKRSFIPSKAERREVVRLATLIKRGLWKKRKLGQKEERKYFDLWKPRDDEEERLQHVTDHIVAPKVPVPAHRDSYNPPPEYMVRKHDVLTLKGKTTEDKDKELFEGFWRKFKSIREIPMYPKTVQNQFERLMDLYITPRKKYRRVVAKSKDFLPKLPNKKDLRPYPTMEEIVFKGHRSIIRTISIHPTGKFLASGSDDHTVRIWEVNTGRCLRTFEVEEAPKTVSWNPNPKLFLVGVAMGRMVVFLNPENHLTDKVVVQQTNAIFKEEVDQGDFIVSDRIKDAVSWRKPTEQEYANGYRLVLEHFKEVKQIVWHKQGDYFATVIPEGDHRSVLMHQLSRWRSQVPFSKNKGRVQTVAFHPKLAQLFVVTQSHIRVYDLQKQGLLKKIQANSRWVSCIDVHPGGEHFIIGGYDRRINWFEMEYTKRPHLMRYHVQAVRGVKFHRKYPLFATCSDDGRVVVAHGMVYDDWLKDPLIVPLKQLKGHSKFDDLHVLDLAWHPYEPYLLTAGADATIRLWH